MRLLVDNPELHTLETGHRIEGNSFERIFAPWPLRFYLIMNSKIVCLSFSFNSYMHVELDLRTKWWNVQFGGT